MRVRVPPQAQFNLEEAKAYLIGLALGDGNLSNSNGRAVRLRISCDKKYPLLIEEIVRVTQIVLPKNKVGLVDRKGCVDVYVYSNSLESILGWQWNKGPKHIHNVGVPEWIFYVTTFTRLCLRGLFQTDGCIYNDRGYMMASFTNVCERLIGDTLSLIKQLGYKPNLQEISQHGHPRYTIRISRRAEEFIEEIGLWKR